MKAGYSTSKPPSLLKKTVYSYVAVTTSAALTQGFALHKFAVRDGATDELKVTLSYKKGTQIEIMERRAYHAIFNSSLHFSCFRNEYILARNVILLYRYYK